MEPIEPTNPSDNPSDLSLKPSNTAFPPDIKGRNVGLDVKERASVQDINLSDSQNIPLPLQEPYHGESQMVGSSGIAGCEDTVLSVPQHRLQLEVCFFGLIRIDQQEV